MFFDKINNALEMNLYLPNEHSNERKGALIKEGQNEETNFIFRDFYYL